jgi:hypothetical protein
MLNLRLRVIRCLENLSSGEKRAGGATTQSQTGIRSRNGLNDEVSNLTAEGLLRKITDASRTVTNRDEQKLSWSRWERFSEQRKN